MKKSESDWIEVELAYCCSDEPEAQIARRLNIGRTALRGRAAREGWERPGPVSRGPLPKKSATHTDEHDPITYTDPLQYMLAVMNNPNATPDRRDKMATAAAPYVHAKKGEGGKKDERQDAAKKASKGKFAAIQPPRLVSSINRNTEEKS